MRRLAFMTVALAAPSFASAQAVDKQFSIVTRFGAATPERAASINAGGFVGVDAEYSLSKHFGLGTSLGVARANTHREDFLTTLKFGRSDVVGGDSVYYQYVGQPVNLIDLSLYGVARAPMGRLTPYALAGVGTYTMLLDAQISGRAQRKNDISLSGGAGFWYRFTERAGIQLDGRLLSLQNYDRRFIDPTSGRFPNSSFPEDFERPPAAKKTATAAIITLGFRYVPGNIGGGN
jgi:hypothetical protein